MYTRAAAALLGVAVLLCPRGEAGAQADTMVVAGPEYAAGALHRKLLGSGYRELWTTPVRVPLLNLHEFAGGLTPVERGGGFQTRSLRFRGADGREYNFRSVNKELTTALPSDLQETLVDDVLQDQISSLHPGATLVATPLLEAAGVLHAAPRLVVMPDDPALGEFRGDFAGMLGTIVLHANEAEDNSPDFAGADKVESTEDFLKELEENPRNRVDARAFLTARLMDLFFGDWDRHGGQWRWARYDRGELRVWQPIPEDQDYVFVNYGGALVRAARPAVPKAVRFDEKIADLYGLNLNAQPLDRRLLSELERPAWDSVATELGARLTDSVIDEAVRRLPAAWYEASGDHIARVLRARRDRLPEVAERFYRQLAGEVEIRASDERDRAEVEQLPGGAIEVRLFTLKDPVPPQPYFRRRFDPRETREVRLFLHGDDDRAVVSGPPGPIRVRVIGGGGDDFLADSTAAGRSRTVLYDARGDNRFHTRPGTRVDRRDYEEPPVVQGRFSAPPRDRGRSVSLFSPYAAWHSNVGPVFGGGPAITQYGFRRDPYGYRIAGRGEWAPSLSRFAVQVEGDIRRESSDARLGLLARASAIEMVRFHGFGNETGSGGGDGDYRIRHDQLLLQAAWQLPFGEHGWISAGPVLKYWNPDFPNDLPLDIVSPLGSEEFGQAGGEAVVAWDARDSRGVPKHGYLLQVGGSAFPPVWDAADAFGRVQLRASMYLTPPTDRITLALRAGGERALGRFPFQEAAFVGGSGTLRGFAHQRFAGDAAVFGGAELRAKLTRAEIVARGDLGVLALADVGRVFADGEDSDTWHTGIGGGIWFAAFDRAVTLAYAHGEDHRLYLYLGFPF